MGYHLLKFPLTWHLFSSHLSKIMIFPHSYLEVHYITKYYTHIRRFKYNIIRQLCVQLQEKPARSERTVRRPTVNFKFRVHRLRTYTHHLNVNCATPSLILSPIIESIKAIVCTAIQVVVCVYIACLEVSNYLQIEYRTHKYLPA